MSRRAEASLSFVLSCEVTSHSVNSDDLPHRPNPSLSVSFKWNINNLIFYLGPHLIVSPALSATPAPISYTTGLLTYDKMYVYSDGRLYNWFVNL